MDESADHLALLKQFAAGRDVLCPNCGSNLRDTSAQKCGECGSNLELVVSTKGNPNPRGWVGGIIGFAMSLGVILGVAATVALLIWVGSLGFSYSLVAGIGGILAVWAALLGFSFTGWVRDRTRVRPMGFEQVARVHRPGSQAHTMALAWVTVFAAIAVVLVSLVA